MIQNIQTTPHWNYSSYPGKPSDRSESTPLNGQEASAAKQRAQQQIDLAVARQVQELKANEDRVVAHERAHQSAGGRYAGAARYTYQRGPDGRMYVSGGEVSIDTSEEGDPEDTIQKMEQVQRAALAPADPSPQDLAVAARAAMSIARARMELALQEMQEQEQEEEHESQFALIA